jgi:K+-sensing histidine kinase KdpD
MVNELTVNTQDTVLDILEAARARHYGTVVVGRESFRGLKALLTSHVGDTLMRQAHDLTVLVVE